MKVATRLFIVLTTTALVAVSLAQDNAQAGSATTVCVVGETGECVTNTDPAVEATSATTTTTTTTATEGGESSGDQVIIDKNCPDRGHIIRCSGEYLDSNKNGKLDRVELDAAIDSLPW
jgi:hypothetical protein